MRCGYDVSLMTKIQLLRIQVSRKLEPDDADDDAQMAAIRQVVHAMAGRRTLPHAQFAARLAKKKVLLSRSSHSLCALHLVTLLLLQMQERAFGSNMRVGSSHGTEAEAQMKRLRSAPAADAALQAAVCNISYTPIRQHMPTLGWWRAGVRVPAPTTSLFHAGGNPDAPAQQPSDTAAAAAWLSSMDHEAEGARNFDLTNYNILLDSTWGGDSENAAGQRLRQMLQPQPPPPLLPPSPPPLRPLTRNQECTGQNAQNDAHAAQMRAASRASLKDRTSAGLFKASVSSAAHMWFVTRVTRLVTRGTCPALTLSSQVLGDGAACTTLALHSQRYAKYFTCYCGV